MSGNVEALSLKEDDVTKMLAAEAHIGESNCDFQMGQYVYKRRSDGPHVINIRRTWEKLLLAARAVVAIEHPSEVFVISSRMFGQRAMLKFAAYTGATPIAGRFTPGAFTNQIQAAFREPRLLIVTDPRSDHQPITEASYVNIPVIAFCNTDSPLRFVDIAIPCNNKGNHAIGLMWWMLTREVLRLRGSIAREIKWDVVVDLFFYREPDEADKEEQAAKEAAPAPAALPAPVKEDFVSAPEAWGGEGEVVSSWADDSTAPTPAAASAAAAAPAVTPGPVVGAAPLAAATFPAPENDWSNQTTDDWSAQPAGNANEWGGASESWS